MAENSGVTSAACNCAAIFSLNNSNTPAKPATTPSSVLQLRKFTFHCGRSITTNDNGATAMTIATTLLAMLCSTHTTAPLPTKHSKKPVIAAFLKSPPGFMLTPVARHHANISNAATRNRIPPSMNGGKPSSASRMKKYVLPQMM